MNSTAFLSADELQRLQRRKQRGRYFEWLALLAVLIGIVVLLTLLIDVFLDGLPWLRPELFTNFPSRFPEKSGLRSALQGTLWLAVITAVLSFPIGVAAAIYLEEYARDNWFTRFIEINISNLAGVPSIIYGLLGLGLFVYGLNLGRSLLAGALTMTLLVLPTVIVSSREAIRAVPRSVRLAAFGLGATPWQTVRDHVLPYAMPGILTGTILAMSRAIGETAPLITIGALTYIRFDLRGPLDLFTVLPIQIFNWISLPQKEFQQLAAAGIIVLLAVLLLLNTTAIILRIRLQKRW
ncbi:phosphate ABC transporter permease PstA [Thermanaerothrix sp.]|jgi:phosphate transport system permease protein|uniref:phosphate ABC transporter permease PstA n=1 Tax=Thermanaerothrix sp. TaxID=2972675 RepID=UPI002ADE0DC2|nr:phosphate ABC transporter permease PstA [Thermanaerothrix sp.]